MRSITTVIERKTERRNLALRRPCAGATRSPHMLFRFRTPFPALHCRRPRSTGRYQAGNRGACGVPETRTPRTALRARRCHRGRSRVPDPAAGVRRRTAEPGPTRPPGDGHGPAGPAARVAFRLPVAWGSCAHLPMVPYLRRGASAGDALYETGGNAVARSQLEFAMAAIGSLYPTPQAAAGPRPVRIAFSLLRVSLLADRDPHG